MVTRLAGAMGAVMREGDSLVGRGRLSGSCRHFNTEAGKAVALQTLFAFHTLKSSMEGQQADDYAAENRASFHCREGARADSQLTPYRLSWREGEGPGLLGAGPYARNHRRGCESRHRSLDGSLFLLWDIHAFLAVP